MSAMLPHTERVLASGLVEAAARLHDEGWRLITASCVRRVGDTFTVLYHFEKGEALRHLRVELGPGEAVPSIAEVHASAFLVENEMIELQGLRVTDLAIDYGGRLYRDIGEPEGAFAPAILLAQAADLRLDACVPITPNGHEMRAPGSRVPPAEGTGPAGNGHGAAGNGRTPQHHAGKGGR